jgi:nucleotide-binding universal stress UspA family protein
MTLLLAVDGSDHTRRMLAWLAAHDELLAEEASYTFITVVPPVPPRVAAYMEHGSVETMYRDAAHQVLEPIVEFARRHGWRFDTLSPVGQPAEAIAEAAVSGRYDLVVMGSHGHGTVGSLLLGSVAQRVLASCRVPVLIVRQ